MKRLSDFCLEFLFQCERDLFHDRVDLFCGQCFLWGGEGEVNGERFFAVWDAFAFVGVKPRNVLDEGINAANGVHHIAVGRVAINDDGEIAL